MADITREELIALCERGRVPQKDWSNRDSAEAQSQLGVAWALLSAGCEFEIERVPGRLNSDDKTWWVSITYEGFAFHESGRSQDRDVDSFYIPTAMRLDRVAGKDWY